MPWGVVWAPPPRGWWRLWLDGPGRGIVSCPGEWCWSGSVRGVRGVVDSVQNGRRLPLCRDEVSGCLQ